jgi:hypothetical protein
MTPNREVTNNHSEEHMNRMVSVPKDKIISILPHPAKNYLDGGSKQKPEGSYWKGNVPLGYFYNVLVTKCPTRLIKFFCAK